MTFVAALSARRTFLRRGGMEIGYAKCVALVFAEDALEAEVKLISMSAQRYPEAEGWECYEPAFVELVQELGGLMTIREVEQT